MANLMQIIAGEKSFGVRRLLTSATVAIDENEHIGVIGPNGAGKTTLFKIFAGLEDLDRGSITRRKGLRIGYLQQHDAWTPGETVESYLSRGTTMPLWDAKALGHDLGLTHEIYERPVESLSGGYRMRCKLLHLLAEEPDLLMLDEPTNYLDLESVLALERFLQGYRGAFLLISHDREFLRRTTDHILEVEAGELTKYPGSLDDYFEQKELLRAQLAARAQSVEDKRKTILDFVARFGAKASKASQAQSRLKSLDRLEKIETKALPSTARIRVPAPTHTSRTVLTLNDVSLGYGDKTVLTGLNFALERGEHLGVVGVNGAGKSTFLKALAGQLKPLLGELKFGMDVSIGYFAQHVSEALSPHHTVLESLAAKAHSSANKQDLLGMAGSLLFSDDDTQKKVAVLSGGEKSRVALGQILLQRAPCLILDEPTNHLDFQTVEALTSALVAYQGTVITVSHDRSFIGRIGTKILEIRAGRAELYPGTYDEYVWSLQKGSLAKRGEAPVVAKPDQKNRITPTAEAPKAALHQERRQAERELRRMDAELKKVDEQLGRASEAVKLISQSLLDRPGDAQTGQWINDLTRNQQLLDEAEKKWLDLSEARAELAERLKPLV
jgi:ATP-binding cassette subfamily F protein 3